MGETLVIPDMSVEELAKLLWSEEFLAKHSGSDLEFYLSMAYAMKVMAKVGKLTIQCDNS